MWGLPTHFGKLTCSMGCNLQPDTSWYFVFGCSHMREWMGSSKKSRTILLVLVLHEQLKTLSCFKTCPHAGCNRDHLVSQRAEKTGSCHILHGHILHVLPYFTVIELLFFSTNPFWPVSPRTSPVSGAEADDADLGDEFMIGFENGAPQLDACIYDPCVLWQA